MTTLRGELRSTATTESEGSGDDIESARTTAVEALDLHGFELQQVNAVTSKATGETTVRAVARSTETKPHEATGRTYEEALQAFRASIPEGWQAQNVREVRE
ncbi:hypothetical protein [Curtobacterium pusillum]|uniref:hypothetical protein n=1 Tax=Curtobacterium pusillum TaxID=69373 RepID=UPI0011A4D653|nr:hypothetical protein [Curtobacterium pusillum]